MFSGKTLNMSGWDIDRRKIGYFKGKYNNNIIKGTNFFFIYLTLAHNYYTTITYIFNVLKTC